MGYVFPQTYFICKNYAHEKLMSQLTTLTPANILVLHLIGSGFWSSRLFIYVKRKFFWTIVITFWWMCVVAISPPLEIAILILASLCSTILCYFIYQWMLDFHYIIRLSIVLFYECSFFFLFLFFFLVQLGLVSLWLTMVNNSWLCLNMFYHS